MREQQKAYEEHLHAEREAKFRQSMELLLHRMVQMESEVSQLTRRLSKAEAEVRQAKVREAKLFTLIREILTCNRHSTDCWKMLNDLLEEFYDGQRQNNR